MENFEFHNPVKLIFGPAESKRIGTEGKALGNKALLVSYADHAFMDALLKPPNKVVQDYSLEELWTEYGDAQEAHARGEAQAVKGQLDICPSVRVEGAEVFASDPRYPRSENRPHTRERVADSEVGCGPLANILRLGLRESCACMRPHGQSRAR